MNKFLTSIGLTAIFGLVVGCTDIDANIASTSSNSDISKFNGIWDITGGTKVASSEVVEECGYGAGTGFMDISGATVKGELTDNSGFSYVLEGSIDESGRVVGAFTYMGYDAATFDGEFSEIFGAGGFKDIYDCPGSWQAKKRDEESIGGVKSLYQTTPVPKGA